MIYVYIIIENANRELYSRALLISEILKKFKKKKITIVIGEKNEIRKKILRFPKGIIIEKGMTKGSIKFVKKWFNLGHKILMFDEESITYRDDKQYFGNKFDKNLENYVDCFFLSGNRQKNTIKSRVKNFKYLLTGNLRFELLKKKFIRIFNDEAKYLKKKYSNYILITSRFANVNYNDVRNVNQPKKIYGSYLEDSKIIFNEYKKLPIKLREKFKNLNIIVRPHPSEDLEILKKITKDIRNCFVMYEGNIVPWIMGAKYVTHNRCTTGIESFFLKKKTISLDPLINKDPLKYFYKELGNNFTSSEKLAKNLRMKFKKKHNHKIIKHFIYNISKENNSHKIISNFFYKKYYNFQTKTDHKFNSVGLIDLIKSFIDKILSIKPGFRKYSNQKIGKFNYSIIKNVLQEFSNFSEYKINKEFKVKQIGKRIFTLTKI